MLYSNKERQREWHQKNNKRLRDIRNDKTNVETFGSAPYQEFPGMPESKPLPEGEEGDIERIRREDPFLYFLLQTETD
jgi:hypothetical protein